VNKTFLLTGGTGFLGSLFAIELIKRGDKVIFLGRSKNNESFRERVQKKLGLIDKDIPLSEIETIEIDLNKTNLNFPENKISELKNKIDGFWHFAANLSFKEKDRQDVFSTNVDGLKNVLNFVEQINTPIYYTSTAYVHGQRPGIIFEDELIKPKRFNNAYEESKFEGEKIIKKWGENARNKFIIFRPSIFIERERKTLSFFGYYLIVYTLYKMKRSSKKEKIKVFFPFPYAKNAFLNLMPIDIAIKWIMEISSKSESLGKTFHITNPKPFPMKDITKQTFEALDIKIPFIQIPGFLISFLLSFLYFISFVIKPIKGLARRFYYYRYYMTEYNIYDMKNTKEIVGQNLSNQFYFSNDFIKKIALDFIKKFEENPRK